MQTLGFEPYVELRFYEYIELYHKFNKMKPKLNEILFQCYAHI